uniref:Polysaccharide pyruvyl transferase domain-containing protein n=1 Tax=Chromera velia CCMP2878 TaxID=1169474 RepID=A0A0G4HLG0_9ALVE|eukprot:Cvel_28801.t1-p1 / transcript=Cvel_28801.t1 / gene=Cvel_28801 / organism=Chromera_velia_CCMP2878 / gene_product=Pyruvyl transferase 1, putative / transcript_product=Pyruvyl transferase 1, putative / location=Cvel_scaffold3836:4258-11272(+) / protein_length=1312 / sequence_SO=supercontig / SO=protein_coding / is_pseudo=false
MASSSVDNAATGGAIVLAAACTTFDSALLSSWGASQAGVGGSLGLAEVLHVACATTRNCLFFLALVVIGLLLSWNPKKVNTPKFSIKFCDRNAVVAGVLLGVGGISTTASLFSGGAVVLQAVRLSDILLHTVILLNLRKSKPEFPLRWISGVIFVLSGGALLLVSGLPSEGGRQGAALPWALIGVVSLVCLCHYANSNLSGAFYTVLVAFICVSVLPIFTSLLSSVPVGISGWSPIALWCGALECGFLFFFFFSVWSRENESLASVCSAASSVGALCALGAFALMTRCERDGWGSVLLWSAVGMGTVGVLLVTQGGGTWGLFLRLKVKHTPAASDLRLPDSVDGEEDGEEEEWRESRETDPVMSSGASRKSVVGITRVGSEHRMHTSASSKSLSPRGPMPSRVGEGGEINGVEGESEAVDGGKEREKGLSSSAERVLPRIQLVGERDREVCCPLLMSPIRHVSSVALPLARLFALIVFFLLVLFLLQRAGVPFFSSPCDPGGHLFSLWGGRRSSGSSVKLPYGTRTATFQGRQVPVTPFNGYLRLAHTPVQTCYEPGPSVFATDASGNPFAFKLTAHQQAGLPRFSGLSAGLYGQNAAIKSVERLAHRAPSVGVEKDTQAAETEGSTAEVAKNANTGVMEETDDHRGPSYRVDIVRSTNPELLSKTPISVDQATDRLSFVLSEGAPYFLSERPSEYIAVAARIFEERKAKAEEAQRAAKERAELKKKKQEQQTAASSAKGGAGGKDSSAEAEKKRLAKLRAESRKADEAVAKEVAKMSASNKSLEKQREIVKKTLGQLLKPYKRALVFGLIDNENKSEALNSLATLKLLDSLGIQVSWFCAVNDRYPCDLTGAEVEISKVLRAAAGETGGAGGKGNSTAAVSSSPSPSPKPTTLPSDGPTTAPDQKTSTSPSSSSSSSSSTTTTAKPPSSSTTTAAASSTSSDSSTSPGTTAPSPAATDGGAPGQPPVLLEAADDKSGGGKRRLDSSPSPSPPPSNSAKAAEEKGKEKEKEKARRTDETASSFGTAAEREEMHGKAEAALNSTVIILSGGPYIGDVWSKQKLMREEVMRRFPAVDVVILPQTVLFKELENVEQHAVEMTHPSASCVVRDLESLGLVSDLEESFEFDSIRLTPDLSVLLETPSEAQLQGVSGDRNATNDYDGQAGVLWVMRGDREGWLHRAPVKAAGVPEKEVLETDWSRYRPTRVAWRSLGYSFGEYAKGVLQERFLKAVQFLRRGEVVVTDRLHVHTLCVTLDKPHVLVNTKGSKISRYYNTWSSGLSSAKLAKTPEEALRMAWGMAKERRKGKGAGKGKR